MGRFTDWLFRRDNIKSKDSSRYEPGFNFAVNPVFADEMEKALGRGRSTMPQWAIGGDVERSGLYEPMWDPRVLRIWYYQNWMLQASINKVVEMATKNGDDFEPKFAFRCDACDIDYEERPRGEKPESETAPDTTPESDTEKQEDNQENENGPFCEECGEPVREADESQIKPVKEFLDAPTRNRVTGRVEKTWKDILRNIVTDMQVGDDWYLELVQAKGGGPPAEMWPLPSEYIRIVAMGEEKLFCPICIQEQATSSPAAYPSAVFFYGLDEDACPICGNEDLRIAAYVQVDDARNVIAAWSEEEILHGNTRAFGSRRYGVPKTLCVFFTAQTLYYMEQYQLARYTQRKMPEGVLSFPGLSQAQVQRNFEELAEWWTVNPHAPKYLILGAQDQPQYLDLALKLVDLEAKEMALFYREAIAIVYGVSLQMLGIQTPGKLGNEQEQVQVSFDTIEEVQQQLEEFVNTKVLPLFGDITDWEWKLNPPEKDDRERKARVQLAVLQVYQQLRSLGAKARLSQDLTDVFMDEPPPEQSIEDMIMERLGGMQVGDEINLPFGERQFGQQSPKPKEPQNIGGGEEPEEPED